MKLFREQRLRTRESSDITLTISIKIQEFSKPTYMYNIPSYSGCICMRRINPHRRRPSARKGPQKWPYSAPPV